jgi:hypothetical protein
MPLRRKGKRQFNLYKYLQYSKKYYFAPDKQSKKLLPSGFTEGQTWGGLYKAWLAFIISKSNDDLDKMQFYAAVIQKLQAELGLHPTPFNELKMSGLGYYSNNAYYMGEEEMKGGDEVVQKMLEELECKEWKT